jgi:hypothetical protein
MYMYARKLLTEGWGTSRDHGVTRSLQGFPSYLRNLRFSETKALFGVYCGRTLRPAPKSRTRPMPMWNWQDRNTTPIYVMPTL